METMVNVVQKDDRVSQEKMAAVLDTYEIN